MKRLTNDRRCGRICPMLAAGNAASAADIKVISSNALKTTLEQLAPGVRKGDRAQSSSSPSARRFR